MVNQRLNVKFFLICFFGISCLLLKVNLSLGLVFSQPQINQSYNFSITPPANPISINSQIDDINFIPPQYIDVYNEFIKEIISDDLNLVTALNIRLDELLNPENIKDLVYNENEKKLIIELNTPLQDITLKGKTYEGLTLKNITVEYNTLNEALIITGFNDQQQKSFQNVIFKNPHQIGLLTKLKQKEEFESSELSNVTEILTIYNDSGKKDKIIFYYKNNQKEEESLTFNLQQKEINYISKGISSPQPRNSTQSDSGANHVTGQSVTNGTSSEETETLNNSDSKVSILSNDSGSSESSLLDGITGNSNTSNKKNNINVANVATGAISLVNFKDDQDNPVTNSDLPLTDIKNSIKIMLDSENLPLKVIKIDKDSIKKKAQKISLEGTVETKEGEKSNYKMVINSEGETSITFYSPIRYELSLGRNVVSKNLRKIEFISNSTKPTPVISSFVHTTLTSGKSMIIYIPTLSDAITLKTTELANISIANIIKLFKETVGIDVTSKKLINKLKTAGINIQDIIKNSKLVITVESRKGEGKGHLVSNIEDIEVKRNGETIQIIAR